MRRTRQTAWTLLLGLALILGACSSDADPETTTTSSSDGGATTTEAPDDTGTTEVSEPEGEDDGESNGEAEMLRIANPEEPPSLDMATQSSAAIAQMLLYNLMEPLVQLDDNGEVAPLIAESWDVSDDGLTYTFNIREGVTFHDGSPLTVDDVVFSYTNARDAEESPHAAVFANAESIEAVDDSTVQVTLAQPDSTFLTNLALRPGAILAERFLEDQGSTPVGTGPFAFVEWNRGESIVLERYEDYWGDLPAVENIEWIFINDESAAVNALLAGDIDGISELNAFSRLQELEDDGNVSVVEAAADNMSILHINNAVEPFDNLRIRQAVAYAIDQEAVVQGWSGGYGEPTDTWVSLQDPWRDDYEPYPYDPDMARQILQEEGHEGLEVEVSAINDSISLPQAEIIMAQLTAAGFNPTLTTYDLATALDLILGQAQYELSPIGVKSIRMLRLSCDFGWFQNYCNPEYDALLQEAITATGSDEINAAFQEAVHFLADDVASVPLISRVNIGAHRNTVSGWRTTNPDGALDLRPLQFNP